MYLRNRKRNVYPCLFQFYFIEFRVRGSLVHGCMSMVLMRSMLLALTGVKLYSPNSFPLLQMTPLILPTVSLAAEKNVQGYSVTFGAIG